MRNDIWNEELQNLDHWDFYNEGNNNIILRYFGPHPILAKKVLRIRKSTNKEFYTDPSLMPEQEYNKLFLENVFMKDPLMKKYLPDTELITIFDNDYLKRIEQKVEPKRDFSKIRACESTIDYENP